MSDQPPPPPPDFFLVSLSEVYPTISTISAVLAGLVILIMIILSIYDFKLVNRVSLRLQTVISALDLWTHTSPHWFQYYNQEPSFMCTFIAWQRQYGPLLNLFFNVSIAVNLQLIFLNEININKKIEIAYWLGPIILGLIITIPLLALGITGFGEFNNCLYTPQAAEVYTIADITTYSMWVGLTLVYCTTIVILVAIKLNKDIDKIRISRRFVNAKDSRRAADKAVLFMRRILLFPIVAIIGNLGAFVSSVYILKHQIPDWGLEVWAMNSVALTGTLNFISFVCDPTVHSAFYAIYKRLRGESKDSGSTFVLNPKASSLTNAQKLDSSYQLTVDDDATLNGEEFTKDIQLL